MFKGIIAGLVLVGLLIGCDAGDSAGHRMQTDSETAKTEATANMSMDAWFASIRIGADFDPKIRPKYFIKIVMSEADETSETFRIHDPRSGTPSYWYVSVRSNKVVRIKTQ